MCLSFNCIKLCFWLAVQNKGVFQGPRDPSVIEQRTPQARPEHSLVPFFPLWCWDLEPSQHFQMTVTCCAAVYPPRMLWSLACCGKSDRYLTTSQWQNRSCEGEGDLFLFIRLSGWFSMRPHVQTWIYENVHLVDVMVLAKVSSLRSIENTKLILYAINGNSRTSMCMCWCFTWSNFAYFPNKIM